jgi:hypothetical protein
VQVINNLILILLIELTLKKSVAGWEDGVLWVILKRLNKLLTIEGLHVKWDCIHIYLDCFIKLSVWLSTTSWSRHEPKRQEAAGYHRNLRATLLSGVSFHCHDTIVTLGVAIRIRTVYFWDMTFCRSPDVSEEPTTMKISVIFNRDYTNKCISFIWHKLAYMFRPGVAIIRALHNKNTKNFSLSI